jgi:endonuclease III
MIIIRETNVSSPMPQPLLLRLAKARFEDHTSQIVHFVDDPVSNAFLNDLENYPHAFVLACLMDRQIKAEKAWVIPDLLRKYLGSFEMEVLAEISRDEYIRLFERLKLHRFNRQMAEIFFLGVQDIRNKYHNDASNIWKGEPSSASVVFRFLEFKGSGVKIATMAANILARQFRIPFSDYYSIDISPDVHIVRVMKRMGFVPQGATNEMVIYKARELNPEFPGIIDFSCWEIGRNWCKPGVPLCGECIVEEECEKRWV